MEGVLMAGKKWRVTLLRSDHYSLVFSLTVKARTKAEAQKLAYGKRPDGGLWFMSTVVPEEDFTEDQRGGAW